MKRHVQYIWCTNFNIWTQWPFNRGGDIKKWLAGTSEKASDRNRLIEMIA